MAFPLPLLYHALFSFPSSLPTMRALHHFSSFIGKTFALWTIVFALLGYFFPALFAPLKGWITPALAIIMFGMGLTLQPRDFAEIVRRPLQVVIGLIAQFTLMPLIALLLTRIFQLDPAIALGVILVGCCPGGTASNVITFLARGDVALSVTITSISTLLAPLLTPLLLQLFAGELITLNLGAMMLTIGKIVILPIVAGVVLHHLLGERIRPAIAALPLVSIGGIVLIIAIIFALNHDKIASHGLLIFAVVILHNLLGNLLGYLAARACGFSAAQRRAIMIEVGMQNSGLGAALANSFFSPAAAVPSALFSVWHNISGALLANLFVRSDNRRGA